MLAGGQVDGKDRIGGIGRLLAATGSGCIEPLAASGRADQHPVQQRHITPLVLLHTLVLGQQVSRLNSAGRRIQLQATRIEHHEHAVVGGHQVARSVVLEDPGADRLAVVELPEKLAVVGVVGHQAVDALDEHPAIGRDRANRTVVPVDRLARPWIAVPQHAQPTTDQLVLGTGRVARVTILVRPTAGSGQLASLQDRKPVAQFRHRLIGQPEAVAPGVVEGMSPTQADGTTAWLQVTRNHITGNRHSAGQQVSITDDKVGEVVRIGNLARCRFMDRDPVSVQTGSRQRLASGCNLGRIRFHSVDLQAAVASQGQSQATGFGSNHKAKPGFNARLGQDRLGRRLVD